jgi:hypothetical protein
MAKLKKLNLEEVENIVKNTFSAAEACRHLGMSTQGSATRLENFLTIIK